MNYFWTNFEQILNSSVFNFWDQAVPASTTVIKNAQNFLIFLQILEVAWSNTGLFHLLILKSFSGFSDVEGFTS